MMKERLIWTFLISSVLICLVGFIKPETDKTAYREKLFWILKTHNHDLQDIIIVGDSRAYRGVSSEFMGEKLSGYRILNFAYSAGNLDERMLSEAEKKLDANGKKIIILSATPLSSTPRSALDEQYLQEKNKDKFETVYVLHLGYLNDFFAPFTKILQIASPNYTAYHQEYHKYGWIASWMIPENPEEGLVSYANAFINNTISAEIERKLLLKTEDWTKRGFYVFAFCPLLASQWLNLKISSAGSVKRNL